MRREDADACVMIYMPQKGEFEPALGFSCCADASWPSRSSSDSSSIAAAVLL